MKDNKLVEKYDDNPGAYFGMLVEDWEKLNEDIEYIKWVQLPNKKWKMWGSSSSSKLDTDFLDRARKQNGINYLDAKISKNGEYPDGVSEEDVEEIHQWKKDESLKEDKFVSRDKMSKKDRKELDSQKRNTWGNTNPVTKVQPNKKAYDRKRDKKVIDEKSEYSFDNPYTGPIEFLFGDEIVSFTPEKDPSTGNTRYIPNFNVKNKDTGSIGKRDKKVVDEDWDIGYWSKDSWGSDYPPDNWEEIVQRANEMILKYSDRHDEEETRDYSARLWDGYCRRARQLARKNKNTISESLTEDSEVFKDMSNALDDIEYLCNDTYNWDINGWNDKENVRRTAERIIESAQILLDSIERY